MADRPVLREQVEILPADDGYRILDRTKNRVHYLNATAAFIALCCDGTATGDAIAGRVQQYFGLSKPEPCQVAEIIGRLSDEQLLTSGPAPATQIDRNREAAPAGQRHQAVRQLPALPPADVYTVPVMISFSLSGLPGSPAEALELPVPSAGDYAPGRLPSFELQHPEPRASGSRERLGFLRRLVTSLKSDGRIQE